MSKLQVISDVDCQDCGACCVFPWGVDVDRECSDAMSEDEKDRLLDFDHHGDLIMATKPQTSTCAAFSTNGKRCRCTIYERRPKVCSDFIVGSDQCNQARWWSGLEEISIDE